MDHPAVRPGPRFVPDPGQSGFFPRRFRYGRACERCRTDEVTPAGETAFASGTLCWFFFMVTEREVCRRRCMSRETHEQEDLVEGLPVAAGSVGLNREATPEPADVGCAPDPVHAGVVVAVRGSVVDIHFDGPLPPIHSLLRAGDGGRVAIEVLAQRDARNVRGIALTPTQGLARGMPVEDTGGPLMAPVGRVEDGESRGE